MVTIEQTQIPYSTLKFGQMDGWMTCDFTSFSTVFQSYRNDERLIMKAVCNGTPFMVEKILPRAGIELGIARSVGQRLAH